MGKMYPLPKWLKWQVELGEMQERRKAMEIDPAHLGEKWRDGQLSFIDREIAKILANEPDKYGPRSSG